jgi:DNA replication protein DnaC
LCIFGNPGVGRTHVMAAIGHEFVRAGHAVFFTHICELVENLLEAKRDLHLSRELQRDRFEGARRHRLCAAGPLRDGGALHPARRALQRKSVMITSNLVFSKWDQIFKGPMTAPAIDRLVHHSVILELTVPSYRAEAAQKASA